MGRGVRLLHATVGVSLGLLCGGLLTWLCPMPDRHTTAPNEPSALHPHWATPFGAAWYEAKKHRRQAYRESGLQHYNVGLPWPEVAEAPETDVRGRALLARDASGDLRRARGLAREALACARTLPERYEATLLLAHLECEAGHHREELRLARKLMALQPRNIASMRLLRQALRCNRMQTPGEGTRRPHPAP